MTITEETINAETALIETVNRLRRDADGKDSYAAQHEDGARQLLADANRLRAVARANREAADQIEAMRNL